jgi:6-phosphofructokinase 1
MRLGVLTSGGDAPGMNAALRTVAITGMARGHRIIGIRRGYDGLLAGDVAELDAAHVDGITRYGGTILGSARSAEFATPAGQAKARQRLSAMGIEALIVIGGNGSLTGAHALVTGGDAPCRVIGLPASIDNDIGHTSLSIGVDTAVNTIVEACDRISDTARAHRRAFLVEVMGRRCGFLAMRAGIAAEADAVLFGEEHVSEDELVARLRQVLRRCFAPGRNRNRALIVKSEGVPVSTERLAERLREHLAEDAPGVDLRETILGHVVRGGSPSALDRLIAGRLGYAAVLAAERGLTDVMLGWDVPAAAGQATPDHAVRAVPIGEVLAETERLLDGSAEVVRRRIALLKQVESLMST